MPVEAESVDHQPLEVPGEEVGQVEGAGLLVGEAVERRQSRVELVAVGAGEALDPRPLEDGVEGPAGPAVGVGDEDRLVARAALADPALDRGRDPLRAHVERGRQAGHVDAAEAAAGASATSSRRARRTR